VEFLPKSISRDAVPAALEKAERYRLLNEADEAESICLDVLAVDPGNQRALVTQLLAITDQFASQPAASAQRARALLPQLADEYRRVYYEGIISERYAMAVLAKGAPRAGESAYESLRAAMDLYEKAEKLRPAGDDEAILRWNTCGRLIERIPHIVPPKAEEYEPSFE
jgi:hypothetical protein